MGKEDQLSCWIVVPLQFECTGYVASVSFVGCPCDSHGSGGLWRCTNASHSSRKWINFYEEMALSFIASLHFMGGSLDFDGSPTVCFSEGVHPPFHNARKETLELE